MAFKEISFSNCGLHRRKGNVFIRNPIGLLLFFSNLRSVLKFFSVISQKYFILIFKDVERLSYRHVLMNAVLGHFNVFFRFHFGYVQFNFI